MDYIFPVLFPSLNQTEKVHLSLYYDNCSITFLCRKIMHCVKDLTDSDFSKKVKNANKNETTATKKHLTNVTIAIASA